MPIPHLRRSPPEDPAEPPAEQPSTFDRGWRESNRPPSADWRTRFTRWIKVLKTLSRRQFQRLRALVRGRRQQRTFLRFWLPVGGGVALLGALFLVVVFAWFSRDLPNPNRIADRAVAQSTRIYARDGSTLLYQIHGDEKRTVVELNQIAPAVIQATIAIEDKDFYRHSGFSLIGIVRALWRDVTTGSSQGGSTITQQFVKNAILTSEKRLTRKIRELVLAYQIERRFTKEQILKLYFNEIPYGANAYGVEAAAETFFGKPAKDLSLAESSILAALPQAPTFYSPYGNHTDLLLGRAHYILDLMVEQGYATKEDVAAAKTVDVLAAVKPKRENILAPHFVFYVRELLTEKYGERLIERGGLRVTTTLDIDKQQAAEQSIADQSPTNDKRWGAKNASLVALDPKTGQVLAMVGSRDYFDDTIDGNVNVALTLQQPGSSIKPIVYATAFTRGYTPETMLFDLKTKFKVPGGPDYAPNNYDGGERGPLTMRKALAGSLNIPAVKTLYLAGIDHVIDQAQRMGYTTWSDRSRLGLSLVLGGAEVKPIEHVAAFGALATDGVLHQTTPILRVEDRDGKVLEEFRDQSAEVLDKEVARQISGVLSDNEARSFVFGSRNRLTLPDRPVAAKTGTTQEFRDAWTVGYTAATSKEPAIATVVWVGNNLNTPMRPGADGSVVAAPIWNAFMRKAVAGTRAVSFKKPKAAPEDLPPILRGKLEGEAPIAVDRVTGNAIPSDCLGAWPAEFVTEKTVRAVHTILHYIDRESPRGGPPSEPTKDLQYASWEDPIQRWAKKNNYLENRPAAESCSLRSADAIALNVTSPASRSTIRQDSVDIVYLATARRTATALDVYLDDQAVLSGSPPNGVVSVPLAGVANGFHAVRLVVRDDVENAAEASLDLNILRDPAVSSAYFISPSPGSSVVLGQTIDVRAFAYDPSGVGVVTFTVQGPSGGAETLGTAAVGTDGAAAVAWQPSGPAGGYTLQFSADRGAGPPLQSDALSVVVRTP